MKFHIEEINDETSSRFSFWWNPDPANSQST